ncbi:MAG: nitroreductase family deazaflavin-dependent oxidoreductase [Mycobacteriales bacterium]
MTSPQDSPVAWVQQHIERYVETAGAEGHVFHGATALLLTVTGRTTGEPRRTALYYVRDGDRYVVVASQGGAPTHPQWYLNLLADPHVTIQVGPDVMPAVATTAGPEERGRLWELSVRNWPAYEEYQAKTEREIPVVVLTPA